MNNIFLCLGICDDIAVSKHEHWSSLAPLPFEVVLSAGQKAKEAGWEKGACNLYVFAATLLAVDQKHHWLYVCLVYLYNVCLLCR